MNKTVLITGSSRGIGKAIAVKFAEEGYRVAINCKKSLQELEAAKNELLSYNVPVLAKAGDAGSYEFAKEFITEVKNTLGSVDILINNAGISHYGLLSDLTPKEWNDMITSNLTSAYNFSSLVIPEMVRAGSGHILNISSVWGNVGASMEVAYSAGKGGLNSFTKALAKELAPSGISVNALSCGAIDTKMNELFTAEEISALVDEIPASRLGKPEEVAELAYMLCNCTTYLTGQIITLDGGWT